MRPQTPSYRSDTGRDDREIAARCRKGDVEAFEELYKRYSARLYGVAYRMTGSAADAEDLLQDVFLQAYRRIDSYRGDAALGTWLYRIAVNACLDYVRSHQGRQQKATDFIEDMGGIQPAAGAMWRPDRALDRIDLERAINRLPPSYRAAFVLHDCEGHEHHEVADLLGIAEGTSKSLLHKARLRLRLLLHGRAADAGTSRTDSDSGSGHARQGER